MVLAGGISTPAILAIQAARPRELAHVVPPSGTFTRGRIGKDTALDITKAPAKGFLTGVIVESKVGYNVYRAGTTPNTLAKYPFKNLVAPNEQGSTELLPLTAWYACVAADGKSVGRTPNGADNAPPIQNGTNIIPAPVSDAVPYLPRV